MFDPEILARGARAKSVIATLAFACAARAVAAEAPGKWRAPRTADGQPDLQGMWTNATITPLERPSEFGDRLVITDAEARAIEAQNDAFAEESAAPTDPKTRTQDLPHSCGLGFSGADCGYNFFWIDRGRQVIAVNGERRSSLITILAGAREEEKRKASVIERDASI
jgi:hypothetical protein